MLKYSSSRIRARFVPGFSTYVNSNYASEKGTLKNIIEGSIGVKISKKKNIWIDAGIFGSPYTNESAISKDHLAYTRSMAAENVPYYLAGVKLGLPIAPKLNAYVYILNGWQRIEDPNNKMSVGTNSNTGPTTTFSLTGTRTRARRVQLPIQHKETGSSTTCILFSRKENSRLNRLLLLRCITQQQSESIKTKLVAGQPDRPI